MAEQSIKVGIANEGETVLPISVLEKWEPKNKYRRTRKYC